MPDNLGNLSEQEYNTAFEYLQRNWRGWHCPVNGSHRTWKLLPMLAQLEPFPGSAITSEYWSAPQKLVYPMLVVACAQCGYSALVNAIDAGVVPDESG
jgi:hypothetical protein